MPREIEIKFRVDDVRDLTRRLRGAGFHEITRSTREINTLYDLPGELLRSSQQLLRLREYGRDWKLTHKSKGKTGRHSSRQELETPVSDGRKMDMILRALGYAPSFRYEKFRAEWVEKKSSRGKGQVVVDRTPIGNFCEIEGPPRWIDATAKKLGVSREQYIMKNYAALFADWKKQTGSRAKEMTFKQVRA
jgi:adenylate cyclase, class 2